MLNIANLNTTNDEMKIRNHFMDIRGVEKVDIVLELKIVTLHYNEEIGSPHKLLTAFSDIGYEVR